MANVGRRHRPANPVPPGEGLKTSRMPGHWLLARVGKRTLRPGGIAMTRWMLDMLAIRPEDRVVELAAGLGVTAQLALARSPASYVGIDRDPDAVATLTALPHPDGTDVRIHQADAARTGLPDGCASVVYGEAMLTMQPEPAKRRIVREARRLLAASGRYAIHELCVVPDDVDPNVVEQVRADLRAAIHVGARPLTVSGWRDLLAEEGFSVVVQMRAPMRLLEPRQLVTDEGLFGAMTIAGRLLRDTDARRRVRQMRRVFRRHRAHLAAVGLIAVPS